VGIVDLTNEVARIDLGRQNVVVLGPPMSGKSTTLLTLAHGLRASSGDSLQFYALGGAASPLAELDFWTDAGFSRSRHEKVAEELWTEIADEEGVTPKVVLFVDAAEDVEGYDLERPLEALAKRECVRLVVACEPSTLQKAYSGWLSTLRRNRAAIYLQPESRVDVETILEVRPALRPGQAFPPGRGILVSSRRWALVQVGRTAGDPRFSAAESASPR
jgi:S-DNA-T family DNA segregation ATPase FtsK/SpoIIIE